MLNITEPHDQLLHLTFLFRMLSSLDMDLSTTLFTLQHAIMYGFVSCSPNLNMVKYSAVICTHFCSFYVKEVIVPELVATLILNISCCSQPFSIDTQLSLLELAYNKVMIKSLNVRVEVIINPSESAYATNSRPSSLYRQLHPIMNLPLSKSGGAFAPSPLSSVSCL